MASWPLWRDAWIQTRHAHLLCLCPYFSPSAQPRRERGTSHTTETSGLSGSHFATVCLHTPQCKWGREREEGDGESGETERGWWNECVCVCVCEMESEAEERKDVILWYLPRRKQSDVVVHASPSLRTCWQGVYHALLCFRASQKIHLCKLARLRCRGYIWVLRLRESSKDWFSIFQVCL